MINIFITLLQIKCDHYNNWFTEQSFVILMERVTEVYHNVISALIFDVLIKMSHI